MLGHRSVNAATLGSMAVPTRTEALRLLLSASPSPRLLRHVTVTAEVAAFLARRARKAGLTVDRRAIETAALLHDIDKALPRDHALVALGHGHAGAAYVSEADHPELARAIAVHPVVRLTDGNADEWVRTGPLLERLVTYADKRSTQRVVSLEKRFMRWHRKHPQHRERLEAAHAAARQLEHGICSELNIEPTDVERLRWVGDALERARKRGRLELDSVPTSAAALDKGRDRADSAST
jgi:putative nucleotidyltransferase with HDIG domain